MWLCASIKPGCTIPPSASRVFRASKQSPRSASAPTATIRDPEIATAPGRKIARFESIEMTCPFRISKSQVRLSTSIYSYLERSTPKGRQAYSGPMAASRFMSSSMSTSSTWLAIDHVLPDGSATRAIRSP